MGIPSGAPDLSWLLCYQLQLYRKVFQYSFNFGKHAVFPRRSDTGAQNLLANHHSLPADGRSISRNVANINKLVQDKIKLFFQNILQHGLTLVYSLIEKVMHCQILFTEFKSRY